MLISINREVRLFFKRRKKKILRILCCGLDTEIVAAIYICAFLIAALILVIWQITRDKCHTEKVKKHLCQDYKDGKIAGTWCHALCEEEVIQLHSCRYESGPSLTFQFEDTVVKLPHSYKTSSPHSQLPEPLSMSQLDKMLQDLLHSKLGQVDVTGLLQKIYKYADFNNNGKLTYGEANSVWQLLNIHEFFILFVFEEDPIFPLRNGTCGPLYAHQHVKASPLFNKHNKTFLDNFFSNTYRWSFPTWDRRVKVAVGLLEYGITFSEKYNAKFYMCDYVEQCFGHTSLFEVSLVSFENIMSEFMIGNILSQKKCSKDSHCQYQNLCHSLCNKQTGKCTSDIMEPSHTSVCEVLRDYVLFDAPVHVKTKLNDLLKKCDRSGRKIDKTGNSREVNEHYVRYNTILFDIQDLLWDEIKNKPPNWLHPPKPKKKPKQNPKFTGK
ncbi:divergent protein kinase domain 1B-like [Saccostrea cucullata]|uniref:divergent protein kinase domain 1B-like n=1 Tax=Saccostrea cuccullata TaxID=36930 RepID=UPI002ED0DB83